MNARFPQDDTEESREGTAAHEVAVYMLAGTPPDVGALTSNGVAVTVEMLEGADLYADTINADLKAAGLDLRYLAVEQRVAIPWVHEMNWGTPDAWFYDRQAVRLKVYDYKFGHDFVDAYENWQCVDYSLGVIDGLAAQMGVPVSLLDQQLIVDIVVAQPRNYDVSGPVRRWSVRAAHLRAMGNKLQAAAARALSPDPVATPGRHCKHCPGRHACNPAQRGAYEAAHLSGASTPVELPPAALAVELAILEEAQALLAARVSGLQEQAEARLRRGEGVPGYALEPVYGRQRWKIPADQIVQLGQMLGVQLGKVEAVTPLQAEKAGLRPELIQQYAEKPNKGVKLVRDNGTAAAKAFGKIN
jgi:hypothetical protein